MMPLHNSNCVSSECSSKEHGKTSINFKFFVLDKFGMQYIWYIFRLESVYPLEEELATLVRLCVCGRANEIASSRLGSLLCRASRFTKSS